LLYLRIDRFPRVLARSKSHVFSLVLRIGDAMAKQASYEVSAKGISVCSSAKH
jgi:hypothetical protein